MRATNDEPTVTDWTKWLLMAVILLPPLGCAQDYGRDTQTQPTASSERSVPNSTVPGTPSATSEPKRGSTAAAGTMTQSSEDARFVASEEQGNKVWKQSSTAAVISLKNRSNKPVVLKAVNTLGAEHGFAIDTMKVKEVIQPGEERTITVPLENIDPTVPEHRVYCQIHPKHVSTTLVFATEQDQNIDTAKGASKSQQGEAALRGTSESPAPTGETEGQRAIRQQSDKQREMQSTSPSDQTPNNLGAAPCEGFPGFDRGCPRGGK